MTDVALSPELFALWERFLALNPPNEELKKLHERYDAETRPLQQLVWTVLWQRLTLPPMADPSGFRGTTERQAATAGERKRLIEDLIARLQAGRG